MTGFAQETDGDYWRALRRILAYDPDQIQLLYATPHRWTAFAQEQANRRVIQTDLSRWDYKHQVLASDCVPDWRVLAWMKLIEAVSQLRPKSLHRLLAHPDPGFRSAMRWYYRIGRQVWPYELWHWIFHDRRTAHGPTLGEFLRLIGAHQVQQRAPHRQGEQVVDNVQNDELRVKVLDFGLAKLTQSLQSALSGSVTSMESLTEEGRIMGTVAYMSPEQAEGKAVDARSDIFSFGSVLYEMLTGKKAFQGNSRISTLSAITEKEPAPLSAEIPSPLERIVTRCLRKDPARRFQAMADVKVELEELKEESESGRLMGLLRLMARRRQSDLEGVRRRRKGGSDHPEGGHTNQATGIGRRDLVERHRRPVQ